MMINLSLINNPAFHVGILGFVFALVVAGLLVLAIGAVRSHILNKKEKKAEPTIPLAYRHMEKVVKDLTTVGYMMEDIFKHSVMWETFPEKERKLSEETLLKFYKESEFKCMALRDEMILTMERMPHIKLKRKGVALPKKLVGKVLGREIKGKVIRNDWVI